MSNDIADLVRADPRVIAAERARDEAREIFDPIDQLWRTAGRAHFNAEMRGLKWDQIGPLKAALAAATERREVAWSKVVAANIEIQNTHAAAWQRAAAAEAPDGRRECVQLQRAR